MPKRGARLARDARHDRSDEIGEVMAQGLTAAENVSDMETAMGASDASNGGGSGAGIPDADTALNAPESLRGDVEQDREKLFPDALPHRHFGQQSDLDPGQLGAPNGT